MTKWLLVFFLLPMSFVALAQQTVFRIDSLPPNKGILLDKGWKWHVGDNLDFAKPDFDDSQWESIDPTKDLMDLPQISRNGQIGWLRIKINVDTNLVNTVFGATINQVGASEIYINGHLLIKFGKISANTKEIEAYNPSSPYKNDYIYSKFGKNKENVIAVRYALQPAIFYVKIVNKPNPIFNITIKSGATLNENTIESRGYDATLSDYFRSGLFFILGILHLLLYFYNRKQKTNLFTSLYYIFGTLFFLTTIALYDYFNAIQSRMYVAIIYYILAFGLSSMTVTIVYSLFPFRKSIFFWAIIFFPIPYFFYLFHEYNWSGLIVRLFPIVMNVEAIRITILAIIKKKKGAWTMMLGTAGWTSCYLALTFLSLVADPQSIKTLIVDNFFYSLSFLIFPICVTIILAKDFANTSKSLEVKLSEVQQLSEEKQNTLLRQNAELQAALLQGQTLERQRVAADLHDNLGTTLSALRWNLEAMDKAKLSTAEQSVLATISQQIGQAYTDVRLLSHNLLPDELAKQGLAVALRILVDKLNRNTAVRFGLSGVDALPRLDRQTEFELYSICLELLNNTIKHAQASEGFVNLTLTSDALHLTVGDNGMGLANQRKDGRGLQNVAARVEALGGSWAMEAELGVQHQILIPLRKPAHVSSQT